MKKTVGSKKTVKNKKIPFYLFKPVPLESDEQQYNRKRIYKTVHQIPEPYNDEQYIVVYGQIIPGTAVNL